MPAGDMNGTLGLIIAFDAFRGTNLVLPFNCNSGAIASINHVTARKSEEKIAKSEEITQQQQSQKKSSI